MIVFSGKPGKEGEASKPYKIVPGMNALLKMLGITLRRDDETGRPRINKHNSVLDREQRKTGTWFEI